MLSLLKRLRALLLDGREAVLVTVGETRGSVPRIAGACMLVSHDASLVGTIGGGQLEHRALAIARELLAGTSTNMPTGLTWVRFPLGASVGQCCGGVVSLAFERVDASSLPWVDLALSLSADNIAWLRFVDFSQACHSSRIVSRGRTALSPPDTTEVRMTTLLAGKESFAQSITEGAKVTYFAHAVIPPRLHIALFGAGHVGRALVRTLAPLPMRITWIDPREDEFSAEIPDNVSVLCSDTPPAEVANLPGGSSYLILTHSHTLDFDVLRAVLDRGDAHFIGLIGSQSKRLSFEKRLRQRGYTDSQLGGIHCPIGVAGITGKEPEVIALAVAVQMMQLARSTQQSQHCEERHVG